MDAGTVYANAKALHELLQEERAKNERLRYALGRACRWMADNYGTCPYDQFELAADEVCENDCTPERVERCWAEYMQGIRWPEDMTMEVGA